MRTVHGGDASDFDDGDFVSNMSHAYEPVLLGSVAVPKHTDRVDHFTAVQPSLKVNR